MNTPYDAVIIGGGAIGLCSAHYLQEAGARVAVLDKSRLDDGASWVNAGLLVPSHIEPIAAPGVVKQGLKWLANPESPFYVKPRFDMDLTRWLWGFQAACTNENVQRAVPILRDLALASLEDLETILAGPGFDQVGFRHGGLLMLHNSKKSEQANLELADLADAAGLVIRRLSREETLDLEPAIRTEMNGSVLFEQDALFDPEAFMRSMISDLESRGVDIFRETEVGEFESGDGKVRSVDADGARFTADYFILATGAWSRGLGSRLGVRLPIEPATGYSITVENPSTALSLPLIVTDQKITVTPMPGRLRIGGTLTLVGFDRTVDSRRIKPLERQALLYAPEYESGGRSLPEPRSGFRPCTTDGLPVIGKPAAYDNLVVAAGHGMLGMTEGPVTGQIVADLCMGRDPSFDLTPVSPDRF